MKIELIRKSIDNWPLKIVN